MIGRQLNPNRGVNPLATFPCSDWLYARKRIIGLCLIQIAGSTRSLRSLVATGFMPGNVSSAYALIQIAGSTRSLRAENHCHLNYSENTVNYSI